VLRAYLLPARALRALLARPANRDLVVEMVTEQLPPTHPPAPLGPIFTRVPGAPLVRDDAPTRDDVDRLLAQQPVPPDRARATWRVVEAVAAGMAASRALTRDERPVGLAPLGLAVPVPEGLVVGSWTPAQAAALPSLSPWLEDAHEQVPAGSDAPDVVVFWWARPTA
jgi:hypothetical protein